MNETQSHHQSIIVDVIDVLLMVLMFILIYSTIKYLIYNYLWKFTVSKLVGFTQIYNYQHQPINNLLVGAVSSTLCCECLDIIVCDGKLKVNIEIGRMFEW